MTELERYIIENREGFDSEPVPSGSRERFMAELSADRRKGRIRILFTGMTGIAASLAALLLISSQPDIERELERHYTRLAEKEKELMIMVENNFPYEKSMIENIARSITTEAIPLEEQLPDELPLKERRRILNDYYNQKYLAMESLIAHYKE